MELSHPIHVIDSHTEGEPTRVVVSGGPDLGQGPISERLERFRGRFDHFRSGIVGEPRGSEVVVGALLLGPVQADSSTAVIFFNDVGYLGMCGHGTIGVVRTLQHLGRLSPGDVRLDTPVGTVSAHLDADGAVTITNVPARRAAADVEVSVPGVGTVRGDVAWGGNWFYLCEYDDLPLTAEHIPELTRLTTMIRDALRAAGITGDDGGDIDHIELFGPPTKAGASGRNFVLCPGAAYDRSPCGTGTSAKLAVLHARGALAIGERWVQESITGSTFTGWLEEREGQLVPRIRGHAFITGEAMLRFDPADPFKYGWGG